MKPFSKKATIRLAVALIIVSVCFIIFTKNNARLYDQTIARVIEEKTIASEEIVDAYRNEDRMTTQLLRLKILNGPDQNKELTTENQYTTSGAYDHHYKVGHDIFIANANDGIELLDVKRDHYFVIISAVFVLTLFLVGNKQGLYSVISLLVNALVISLALDFYIAYSSISLVLICAVSVLFLATFSLLLVNGRNEKTYTAIIATLIGTTLSLAIAFIVIKLLNAQGIYYEEMQFLSRPYEMVFLASLFVGSLGAVMDIAITMTASIFEIYEKNNQISISALKKSGKNVGQDVMGTMANILFFVYVSGSIPMLVLYLKNGAPLNFALSMNLSLELARALVGGIGVVLTIPIGLYTALFFVRRKQVQK